MRDRNEWFKDVKRLMRGLKVETVGNPFACPTVTSVTDGEDVRERSLTKPNVLSVRCPTCGMSNSVAWGSMDLPPFRQAVAMLADSWNSR